MTNKILKKIITAISIIAIAISSNLTNVLASANSVTTVVNPKTVDLSGSKKYGNYFCNTYMKGNLYWISGVTAKFSGTTGGKYTGNKKADTITHVDTVSASGIGSISVGYKAANCSISGSKASFTYTSKNSNCINNYASYTASKGFTFSVTVSCSTSYVFGSTNYRVVPGD